MQIRHAIHFVCLFWFSIYCCVSWEYLSRSKLKKVSFSVVVAVVVSKCSLSTSDHSSTCQLQRYARDGSVQPFANGLMINLNIMRRIMFFTTTSEKMYGEKISGKWIFMRSAIIVSAHLLYWAMRARMNYECQINKDLGHLVVKRHKKNSISFTKQIFVLTIEKTKSRWDDIICCCGPSLVCEKPKWRLVNGANLSNVQHNESKWFISHCLINCSLLSCTSLNCGCGTAWLAVHRHLHSLHIQQVLLCCRLPSTIRPEHTHTHCTPALLLPRYFFFCAIFFFLRSANENETERNHFFHFPIQCGDGYDVFITHFFSRSFLFTQLQLFFSCYFVCECVCTCILLSVVGYSCRMAFFLQIRLLFRSFFFYGSVFEKLHSMIWNALVKKTWFSGSRSATEKKCTQIKWKFKISERYESLEKLLLCTVRCWGPVLNLTLFPLACFSLV